MTEETASLSKICTICGLQKPLNAYLQWQEGVGAIYGSICADCRQAGLDNEKVDRDETTVSTTGNKIDAKAKVATDIDKLQHHLASETEYFKEREENALDAHQQDQKTQHIAQSEKTHREDYLRTKSFLDQRKVLASQPKVFAGETERANEAKIDLTVAPIDTQITGKLKFQTGEFNRFKTLLGTSAPIVRGETPKGKEAIQQFIDEKWNTSPTRKR